MSRDGRHVSVHASNVPVIDTLVLGGTTSIPASVSWSMEWHATGAFAAHGSGKTVGATDPAAFSAKLAPAVATGSFSGRELGFTFRSDPGVTTDNSAQKGYAEVGFEKNGSFLT